MNRLFVIGDPIAHSKSPLIQNAMLRELGLSEEWSYSARRVPGKETAAWLAWAKTQDCRGFNATMPHKEHLVSLVDELSPEAAACQSVNTVCIREGRAFGFSTDGRGFLQSLTDAGIDPRGGKVVLLGAGGAARAVALQLAKLEVEEIAICNRSLERAQALCACAPGKLKPVGFSRAELERALDRCALLVNCTPLGMEGIGRQFEDLSFLQALPPQGAVCDLVYSPAETELLARARAEGHRTLNGLGMLLYQGIFALEHFLNRKLDLVRMRQIAECALSGEGEKGWKRVCY